MVARVAWAATIKRKINPATKKEYPLDIQYEPTANPKPLAFTADIVPISEKHLAMVRRAVQEGLESDPLG
jgi:hypothetical protein